MKKKIIGIIVLLFLTCGCTFAKTIAVQAEADLSTENPPETYSVKVLQNLCADETVLFKSGDILEGKIVDVTDPKRLKRDAKFTFVPLTVRDADGNVTELKGYYPAKYTTKVNKADIAKTAALGVGNYFVQGLSIGFNALEGVVKNEKNNRFKSGVNSVYESTPISLIRKGYELEIKKEQVFFLNFKLNDELES